MTEGKFYGVKFQQLMVAILLSKNAQTYNITRLSDHKQCICMQQLVQNPQCGCLKACTH